VLPILLVLGTVAQRGLPLSALVQDLPQRFTHSERLQHVPTAWSAGLIEGLGSDEVRIAGLLAPDSGAVAMIDRTDGLRVTFASGDIVHLRPSGNAPELRCYTEADRVERAATLCMDCLSRIGDLVAG
jgi:phosphomannomutase